MDEGIKDSSSSASKEDVGDCMEAFALETWCLAEGRSWRET